MEEGAEVHLRWGGGGGETLLSMFLYYAYMVKLAKHYTIHVQDNKYM